MESRKLSISTVVFLLHFAVSLANKTELVVDDNNNNRKLGFSLELVHCDSVDSPLYAGNLTSAERMQRDVRVSESRRIWLESSAAVGPQDLNIRPILSKYEFKYTVKVDIGTDPRIESHLLVDTGSGLVWVQSEPCNTCFEHDGPGYKPTQSHSYRSLPSSHPICKEETFLRSSTGQCTYNFEYGIKAANYKHTRGALAFEKFSFESKSDPRSLATVDDVIFGASNNNSEDIFQNKRKLVGILGMSGAKFSFPIQMAHRDRRLGRFSYCLVPDDGASSHLRFGDDVVMQDPQGYQTTPLLNRPNGFYGLKLSDVSIDGKALPLPPGTFIRNRARRSDGVVIDSGAPLTYFIEPAYDEVVKALVGYFGERKLRRVIYPPSDGKDLCYVMPDRNFDGFPDIGFHFEGGAILRPDRNHVFNIVRERREFCLFMARARTITLIGARVQNNVHFVYDLLGKQLHFAPKDCRDA